MNHTHSNNKPATLPLATRINVQFVSPPPVQIQITFANPLPPQTACEMQKNHASCKHPALNAQLSLNETL